jgi:Enoyl-CoA hydratase/isomerase
MARFESDKDAFPHARLTRSPKGVLEVVLHTDGGTLIFDGHTHEEFVDLFHQIGQDAANRVVILTDIVIATPDTIFQDKPHFAFGIVPGDGIHSLWPEVIGSIRGRTFVLTQQVLSVDEAKALGVVSEIVPRERLLDRAREIAARIAELPPLTVSYTRVALTQKLRRVVDESVGYGLALEGISAADVARSR